MISAQQSAQVTLLTNWATPALEDGQVHNFDIICRSYIKNSDHYDPDYSEYYLGDLAFLGME